MKETKSSGFPQFSDEEIERRRALVPDFVEQNHLDGLVVFGWSAQNRTAQADVYYLSGYMGMRDNYVVFPLEGEPTLFAQSYNQCPTRPRSPFSTTSVGVESTTQCGHSRRNGGGPGWRAVCRNRRRSTFTSTRSRSS